MAEIIIPDPEINTNPWRRYTYSSEGIRLLIPSQLSHEGITPQTHPQVVDLCAGDGSIARILADNGWSLSIITCIDKLVSPTPLVEGVRWLYWDLRELAKSVIGDVSLPTEVVKKRNSFDVVCLWSGIDEDETKNIGWLERKIICDFFVKPTGYISTDVLN